MKSVMWVALGGGLGSVARYMLGAWVLHHTVSWKFPAGTFLVNVLGCLIAGILAGLAERYELFSPETRVFLFVGILGGFTTFSAFGLETMFLLRRGEVWIAGLNIVASVICGIVALWIGLKLVALFAR